MESKTVYLANAWSGQMVDEAAYDLKVREVSSLPNGLTSAVGHPDTARVLGVEMNRVNIKLNIGDVIYVAQLVGGRLPEGCTVLPEGYRFRFQRYEVVPAVD